MKIASVFIFFLVYVFSSFEAKASNEIEAEFHRMCKSNLQFLEQHAPIVLSGVKIDLTSMKMALQKSRIQITQERLFIDNKAVDAINDPLKNLVTINQSAWLDLDYFGKSQLCLHEIWGLSFHDHRDNDYHYSTQMVNMLRISSLKSTTGFIHCISNEQKSTVSTEISIGVPSEFVTTFISSLSKNILPLDINSFAEWTDINGNFSQNFQAFVSIEKNNIQVDKYSYNKFTKVERLVMPLGNGKQQGQKIFPSAAADTQLLTCEITL